jgi:hypothetical protein
MNQMKKVQPKCSRKVFLSAATMQMERWMFIREDYCTRLASTMAERCGPAGDGAPRSFCLEWANEARIRCGTRPCEQQLCHWLGQCQLGPCRESERLLPPSSGQEHVCSYLVTSSDSTRTPYLAYRVASKCDLRLQSAPLYEDVLVETGRGQEVAAMLGDAD